MFARVFLICYLMTMSVTRLYSGDDRMINEYGAVGGMTMRITRGNRSSRRKPVPVPLSTIIGHDLTWDRIRAPAVGKLSVFVDIDMSICLSPQVDWQPW
jgi:hypothetical protein